MGTDLDVYVVLDPEAIFTDCIVVSEKIAFCRNSKLFRQIEGPFAGERDAVVRSVSLLDGTAVYLGDPEEEFRLESPSYGLPKAFVWAEDLLKLDPGNDPYAAATLERIRALPGMTPLILFWT